MQKKLTFCKECLWYCIKISAGILCLYRIYPGLKKNILSGRGRSCLLDQSPFVLAAGATLYESYLTLHSLFCSNSHNNNNQSFNAAKKNTYALQYEKYKNIIINWLFLYGGIMVAQAAIKALSSGDLYLLKSFLQSPQVSASNLHLSYKNSLPGFLTLSAYLLTGLNTIFYATKNIQNA
jgi:hypothetical protein